MYEKGGVVEECVPTVECICHLLRIRFNYNILQTLLPANVHSIKHSRGFHHSHIPVSFETSAGHNPYVAIAVPNYHPQTLPSISISRGVHVDFEHPLIWGFPFREDIMFPSTFCS
uniref:Uncharacterized protein n=1 Tax=Opuntia streptacantha TaxID=393608 RepID=A0A7C9AK69_OPUST